MIAMTTRPTRPPMAIGTQLVPPATFTGVIGFRPLPPPLAPPGRSPPAPPLALEPAALAPVAGGLPWPEVLPTLTVDGTRSGPGVLMLMVPRRCHSRGLAGVRWPPSAKVSPR